MKLSIATNVFQRLLAAAREAAPLEACGLCAGRDGSVSRFYPLTNLDASAEHFRMDPAEQFAAVKDMRARDLSLLAIWHSHPATPARMSDEDLRLAFTPATVYLILSLAEPDRPVLKGFMVDGHRPLPVVIELETAAPESHRRPTLDTRHPTDDTRHTNNS